MMPIYVMLMRHGAWMFDASRPPQRVLTSAGREQVKQVAGKLNEFIIETSRLDQHALQLRRIWLAGSSEAQETADILAKCLAPNGIAVEPPKDKLTPCCTSPYGPVGQIQPLIKQLIEHFATAPQGDALLIVGHQPMLGWIAEALCDEPYPIAHAELLCLCFDKPPVKRQRLYRPSRCLVNTPAALRWALTPRDRDAEKTLTELKEKIRGKMEGAKLLGAVITGALGFTLGMLIDDAKLDAVEGYYLAVLYASVLAFLLAGICYFASYYAYDRLLMPIRFWADGGSAGSNPAWLVMRPPSSATWVLYQNMIHVWQCLFTPAMMFTFAGLILLGFAVLRPTRGWLLVCVIVLLVFGAALKPLYRRLGPRLGSED
jgi:phosphohistidine phosphatase SixA